MAGDALSVFEGTAAEKVTDDASMWASGLSAENY